MGPGGAAKSANKGPALSWKGSWRKRRFQQSRSALCPAWLVALQSPGCSGKQQNVLFGFPGDSRSPQPARSLGLAPLVTWLIIDSVNSRARVRAEHFEFKPGTSRPRWQALSSPLAPLGGDIDLSLEKASCQQNVLRGTPRRRGNPLAFAPTALVVFFSPGFLEARPRGGTRD